MSNLIPYESPSTLWRRIEREEAEAEEFSSIASLTREEDRSADSLSYDDTGDHSALSSNNSATARPFQTRVPSSSSSGTARPPPTAHQSTPKNINGRPSSPTALSQSRFAASLKSRVSRNSSSISPGSEEDVSYDISRIDRAPNSLDINITNMGIDAPEDASSLILPRVAPPSDSFRSSADMKDALGPLTGSTTPPGAPMRQEPESSMGSSMSDPLRDSIYVSKRKPMPRLLDDFMKSPASISRNSISPTHQLPQSRPLSQSEPARAPSPRSPSFSEQFTQSLSPSSFSQGDLSAKSHRSVSYRDRSVAESRPHSKSLESVNLASSRGARPSPEPQAQPEQDQDISYEDEQAEEELEAHEGSVPPPANSFRRSLSYGNSSSFSSNERGPRYASAVEQQSFREDFGTFTRDFRDLSDVPEVSEENLSASFVNRSNDRSRSLRTSSQLGSRRPQSAPPENQEPSLLYEEDDADLPQQDEDEESAPSTAVRPKARFTTPFPPSPAPVQQTPAPRFPPSRATPGTEHSKAFILSLNSGAAAAPRPRFSLTTTPHPFNRAGLLRAEGARTSHPLSQAYSPEPAPPQSPDSSSNMGAVVPVTPTNAQDSFVSTASSHDLLAPSYARANASFDPLTDGRATKATAFNQVKLNTYLHGLNKHLIDENKDLSKRLEISQREIAELWERMDSESQNGARAGGGVTAELVKALQEELARTKAERDTFKADSDRLRAENEDVDVLRGKLDDVEATLREKSEKSERDLRDVRDGAQQIIDELGVELENTKGECTDLKRRLEVAKGSEDDRVQEAETRADAARAAKDKADVEVGKVRRDMEDLEREKGRALERIGELEKEAREERAKAKNLALEVEEKERERLRSVHEYQGKLAQVEAERDEGIRTVASLEDELAASEQRGKALNSTIQNMQQALEDSQGRDEEIRVLKKRVDTLAKERDAAEADLATRGPSRAPSSSPNNKPVIAIIDDRGQRSIVASDLSFTSSSGSSTVSEHGPIPLSEHNRILGELEAELDEAQREIGRLKHEQSPAGAAIATARALRIETLEKENQALIGKLESLSAAMQNASKTGSVHGTPVRGNDLSMMGTPALPRALALLKTPKTPGGPLKDLSWLNSSSMNGTVDAAPFMERINDLYGQLEIAGEHLDHAVEELGEAGLSNTRLTELLSESRGRVGELEKEIDTLLKNEDRVRKRLERCKCLKCGKRFDASGVVTLEGNDSMNASHVSIDVSLDDPAQSRANLRAELRVVNDELSALRVQWGNERNTLIREKVALKDAANRLNAEVEAEAAKVDAERRKASDAVRHVHDEAAREKALLQVELDHARSSISGLENELREERSRLRSLITEQSRVSKEKNEVGDKLSRVEAAMLDVRAEMDRLKNDKRVLENELHRNTNADKKTQRLTDQIIENQAFIEQLRQERAGLAADHLDLQRRFAQVADDTEAIRKQLAVSRFAHDERRHQLDLRVTEIEDLRSALEEQAAQVAFVKADKKRIAAEGQNVAHNVTELEAEVRRLKRRADRIQSDLDGLQVERDGLVARRKEDDVIAERSRSQIRAMHDQIVSLQKKVRKTEDAFAEHVCVADDEALAHLQQVHRAECKGLIKQIKYQKAMYTRESGFREDLQHQKSYLLKTVAFFDKSEQNIIAAIARMGFPRPRPPPKRRTLRAVGVAVLFACRAKLASKAWRKEVSNAARPEMANALQDARRRRAIGSTA